MKDVLTVLTTCLIKYKSFEKMVLTEKNKFRDREDSILSYFEKI